MRSLFISGLSICLFLSCAKKTTPAASADTKTPAATKDVVENPMVTAGHTTFEAKCGRCHGLKNPGDYTAQQWIPIMNSMAPKARLDSTEKANVLAYVTAKAKS